MTRPLLRLFSGAATLGLFTPARKFEMSICGEKNDPCVDTYQACLCVRVCVIFLSWAFKCFLQEALHCLLC